MKSLLLALLFIKGFDAHAEKYYDFNPACQQAYHELFSLRIENGKKLLAQEKETHPDNLIPYFLDNYADLYPLFLMKNTQSLIRSCH